MSVGPDEHTPLMTVTEDTCGRHDMTEPPAEDGAYLRVWSRQPDGQWRVAADVTAPAGP